MTFEAARRRRAEDIGNDRQSRTLACPVLTTAVSLVAVLLILSPNTSGQTAAPTLSTLHDFSGSDGANPAAGVVAIGGVLYGTTHRGGIGPCTYSAPPGSGCGTVFSLTPSTPGGAWTQTTLHEFVGTDGAEPNALIAIGGTVYGTTYGGGSSRYFGTVFSLTPPGSSGGTWSETVLHSFTGLSDGAYPSGVVAGPNEVLYGTTAGGGTSGFWGTVFSLSPPTSPGRGWTQTVLYNFTGGSDGGGPGAPVVIGNGGVLYGTTADVGSSGYGKVYSLTPPASSGGTWTETVLYAFTGGSDGDRPYAIVIGSGGVLYGITEFGGASSGGTVFSLTPPASLGGAWTETVLHSFSGRDGLQPVGGLIIGPGGVLFGTTRLGGSLSYGTVFSLTPPGSPGGTWTEKVLHNFAGNDGSSPVASLVAGDGGLLYGTTYYGGTGSSCGVGALPGCGTVFSLKP